MEKPKNEPFIFIDRPPGGAACNATLNAFGGGGFGKDGAVNFIGLYA
jgi:hypothetical protein